MPVSVGVPSEELVEPVDQLDAAALAALVAEPVPDRCGLDRMTPRRLEEFLTPVALTAHL